MKNEQSHCIKEITKLERLLMIRSLIKKSGKVSRPAFSCAGGSIDSAPSRAD